MTAESNWTSNGITLLGEIHAMIHTSGGARTLAYQILLENPEYFRNYKEQFKAKKHLYFKQHSPISSRPDYFWTDADKEKLLASLELGNTELRILFPNRTWKAITHIKNKLANG